LSTHALVSFSIDDRLWSISFVAPPDADDQNTHENAPCVDIKVVYPGQITIRYGIGRNLLIYDMFEFQPTTVDEFKQLYSNNHHVCRESEIDEVERLLKSTKWKRAMADRFMERMYGMSPPESPDCSSLDENTSQQCIDAIGQEKFCHLLQLHSI
jgi:hypothetical protein